MLENETVTYLNWEDLRRALDHDIEQERNFSYKGITSNIMISHITRFVSSLWQIHAFGEGNTRTTAVFTIQYLRSIGLDLTSPTTCLQNTHSISEMHWCTQTTRTP